MSQPRISTTNVQFSDGGSVEISEKVFFSWLRRTAAAANNNTSGTLVSSNIRTITDPTPCRLLISPTQVRIYRRGEGKPSVLIERYNSTASSSSPRRSSAISVQYVVQQKTIVISSLSSAQTRLDEQLPLPDQQHNVFSRLHAPPRSSSKKAHNNVLSLQKSNVGLTFASETDSRIIFNVLNEELMSGGSEGEGEKKGPDRDPGAFQQTSDLSSKQMKDVDEGHTDSPVDALVDLPHHHHYPPRSSSKSSEREQRKSHSIRRDLMFSELSSDSHFDPTARSRILQLAESYHHRSLELSKFYAELDQIEIGEKQRVDMLRHASENQVRKHKEFLDGFRKAEANRMVQRAVNRVNDVLMTRLAEADRQQNAFEVARLSQIYQHRGAASNINNSSGEPCNPQEASLLESAALEGPERLEDTRQKLWETVQQESAKIWGDFRTTVRHQARRDIQRIQEASLDAFSRLDSGQEDHPWFSQKSLNIESRSSPADTLKFSRQKHEEKLKAATTSTTAASLELHHEWSSLSSPRSAMSPADRRRLGILQQIRETMNEYDALRCNNREREGGVGHHHHQHQEGEGTSDPPHQHELADPTQIAEETHRLMLVKMLMKQYESEVHRHHHHHQGQTTTHNMDVDGPRNNHSSFLEDPNPTAREGGGGGGEAIIPTTGTTNSTWAPRSPQQLWVSEGEARLFDLPYHTEGPISRRDGVPDGLSASRHPEHTTTTTTASSPSGLNEDPSIRAAREAELRLLSNFTRSATTLNILEHTTPMTTGVESPADQGGGPVLKGKPSELQFQSEKVQASRNPPTNTTGNVRQETSTDIPIPTPKKSVVPPPPPPKKSSVIPPSLPPPKPPANVVSALNGQSDSTVGSPRSMMEGEPNPSSVVKEGNVTERANVDVLSSSSVHAASSSTEPKPQQKQEALPQQHAPTPTGIPQSLRPTPSTSSGSSTVSPQTIGPDWNGQVDPNTGRTYYVHTKTRKTTWKVEDTFAVDSTATTLGAKGETPSMSSPTKNNGNTKLPVSHQPQLAADWKEEKDPNTGRTFYYNVKTRARTWKIDDALLAANNNSERDNMDVVGEKKDAAIAAVAAGTAQKSSSSDTLLTPLEPNWKERVDPQTGKTFYYNTITKVTSWDRRVATGGGSAAPVLKQPVPQQASAPATPQLPNGWKSVVDNTGRTYYYHKDTKKTSWTVPVA